MAGIFGAFSVVSVSQEKEHKKVWDFPNMVVSNLVVCKFLRDEALFCALLCSFALLHLRSLLVSASDHV